MSFERTGKREDGGAARVFIGGRTARRTRKGSGARGRLPCGRDGRGGLPFGRAPSAGERKERGARKKEREGDGSADMRGQGRSEREKEQRAWAKRVRAVQRRRAVKGRSGAGRANGAPAGPRGRVVRSRPAWEGEVRAEGEMRWTGPPAVGCRAVGWCAGNRKEAGQARERRKELGRPNLELG